MLVAVAARSDAAFTLLHSHNDVQAYPAAAVIADGLGNLYGTTVAGGFSNAGTVFKVKTDGTGFTLLHAFAAGPSDGENPRAPLILDGSGNLYGTTSGGGSSYVGTVFRVKTDGTGFTLLHSFAEGESVGENPSSSLILDRSGNLYGTTGGGGSSNLG
ncbi:MAG TPA: choice-of-anchor tandem repeat GloVer-containing protein, partial [Thermoanaerobaculia bacterium]|nr:choice-of-anchor tandem repeat GloVer-containing protein [Thermoanaerobaculia bacterium]